MLTGGKILETITIKSLRLLVPIIIILQFTSCNTEAPVKELAKEKGLKVDLKGFEEAFKEHREISRAGV